MEMLGNVRSVTCGPKLMVSKGGPDFADGSLPGEETFEPLRSHSPGLAGLNRRHVGIQRRKHSECLSKPVEAPMEGLRWILRRQGWHLTCRYSGGHDNTDNDLQRRLYVIGFARTHGQNRSKEIAVRLDGPREERSQIDQL